MEANTLISPHDQRATFIELFFDLVFVFCITQVVVLLHQGLTWGRAAEATLVFWIVWWAWTQFTWALNAANTDHARIRLATLLATAVAFFMAVSVPGAFGESALWFAIPYVIVRGIGLTIYFWAAEDDEHRQAIRVFAMSSISGLVVVLIGAAAGGATQYWLWGAAIFLDVVAGLLGAGQGRWNLHHQHFAERHGLIVIIALGESLIVAGAGLVGVPMTVDVVAVAVLSVTLTCGLWWTYFPYLMPSMEHALGATDERHQAALARDTFSFWHFPLLCGVVGIAAGVEEAILHPGDPLPADWRAALATGLLLFFLGSGLAMWRATGKRSLVRVGVGVLIASIVYALGSFPPAAPLGVAIVGVATIVILENGAMRGMR